MAKIRRYRIKYYDVYGKITDGENVIFKKLVTISSFVQNRNYCKMFKTDIDGLEQMYKKHLAWVWYNQVIASDYSPEWVKSRSSDITIMAIHKPNKDDEPLTTSLNKAKKRGEN